MSVSRGVSKSFRFLIAVIALLSFFPPTTALAADKRDSGTQCKIVKVRVRENGNTVVKKKRRCTSAALRPAPRRPATPTAPTIQQCTPNTVPIPLCSNPDGGVLLKNCRAEFISPSSALLSWETVANNNLLPVQLRGKGVVAPLRAAAAVMLEDSTGTLAWGSSFVNVDPGRQASEHFVHAGTPFPAGSPPLQPGSVYRAKLINTAMSGTGYTLGQGGHNGETLSPSPVCFRTALQTEERPTVSSISFNWVNIQSAGALRVRGVVSGELAEAALFIQSQGAALRRVATLRPGAGSSAVELVWDTATVPNNTYALYLGVQNSARYGMITSVGNIVVANQAFSESQTGMGPTITSVVSLGSNSSEMAPAGIIRISGTNFSSTRFSSTNAPLPEALGGVGVFFKIDGVYQPAPLFSVSPTEIQLQVPIDTLQVAMTPSSVPFPIQTEILVRSPTGFVNHPVQISKYALAFYEQEVGEVSSIPGQIRIPRMYQAAPLYRAVQFPFSDFGYLAPVSMLRDETFINPRTKKNDPTIRWAHRGEIIIIYLNGLGVRHDDGLIRGWPASNGYPLSKIGVSSFDEQPEITIGSVLINENSVRYGFASPYGVGVDQINFTLPATLQPGLYPIKVCMRAIDNHTKTPVNNRPTVCTPPGYYIPVTDTPSPHPNAVGNQLFGVQSQVLEKLDRVIATDAPSGTEILYAPDVTVPPLYSLCVSVTSSGTPLSEVQVGSSLGSRATDSTGRVCFLPLALGAEYTVTPLKTGYTFSPPNIRVKVEGNTVINFEGTLVAPTTTTSTTTTTTTTTTTATTSTSTTTTTTTTTTSTSTTTTTTTTTTSTTTTTTTTTTTSPPPVNLCGDVKISGAGLAGVSMNGGALGVVSTDSAGRYCFFSVPTGAQYSVTPSKEGYEFTPRVATGLAAANTAVNFSAAVQLVTISGNISWGAQPIVGLVIDGSGALGTATTDAAGNYTFKNVPYGTEFTLTPRAKTEAVRTQYTFSPPAHSGAAGKDGGVPRNFSATVVPAELRPLPPRPPRPPRPGGVVIFP